MISTTAVKMGVIAENRQVVTAALEYQIHFGHQQQNVKSRNLLKCQNIGLKIGTKVGRVRHFGSFEFNECNKVSVTLALDSELLVKIIKSNSCVWCFKTICLVSLNTHYIYFLNISNE